MKSVFSGEYMLINLILGYVFVEYFRTEILQRSNSEAEIGLSFVPKIDDLPAKDVPMLRSVIEISTQALGSEIEFLQFESFHLLIHSEMYKTWDFVHDFNSSATNANEVDAVQGRRSYVFGRSDIQHLLHFISSHGDGCTSNPVEDPLCLSLQRWWQIVDSRKYAMIPAYFDISHIRVVCRGFANVHFIQALREYTELLFDFLEVRELLCIV